MRILLVSEHFPPGFAGGSAVYLDALARGLVRRGHEVSVVAGGPVGVEERDGLAIRRTGSDPAHAGLRTRLRELAAFRRATEETLRRGRFDLVHLNHAWPSLGAILALRGRSLPRVATFYAPYHLEWRAFGGLGRDGRPKLASRVAGLLGYARLVQALERRIFRRVRRAIALSAYSKAQLLETFALDAGRVDLVPGGVDAERFRPCKDRRGERRRLGIPEDRLVLLTVRRLDPRMGLEDLVRATAALRGMRPAPFLLVVGKGRLGPALAALAREVGLEGNVGWAGFVPDAEVPAYYAAADLFVLPTRSLEAFGLVTVEALASGVPVLGTAVGGTPEILAPLDPRLVLEGAGPEGIAAGIERAAREGLLADGFGARCRAYAVERFSWDRAVDALERSYRRALEGEA
ncbi:MAG TPA: glycosyltransferase family 4 protein [Planctomycetota bacterium]|nr:glycosyltransferase family 4 protein [Planctomycetota bacterium]